MIEEGYRSEHPDWSEADVLARSRQVSDARFDAVLGWYNSQRRFRKYNSLSGFDPEDFDTAEG